MSLLEKMEKLLKDMEDSRNTCLNEAKENQGKDDNAYLIQMAASIALSGAIGDLKRIIDSEKKV